MGKKIGVICASGIGDCLILQIASHHLREKGWEVTTFSDHLASFGPWFPHALAAPQPLPFQVETLLRPFDALFLQHDNSPKAKAIRTLPLPVYCFYGSHHLGKHLPLRPHFDFVCDPNKTMVENTCASVERFFGSCAKENGMQPPPGLLHRRYKRRIAIHPTSRHPKKNWPRKHYLILASWLKKEGYDPIFAVAPEERDAWEGAPLFTSLAELAAFLYESGFFIGNDSGLGHIASRLAIPHLILAPDPIPLWRPGWHLPVIAHPPSWVSYWKWTQERWQLFLRKNSVIKKLKNNVLTN